MLDKVNEISSNIKANNFSYFKSDIYHSYIKKLLPIDCGINSNRFISSFFYYLSMNKQLKQCTIHSISRCLLESASIGLCPNIFGHVYIIPYGKTATLMIGYQGLIEVAIRCNYISSLTSNVVRKSDEFKVTYGTKPEIIHIPLFRFNEEITHVYSIININKDSQLFEVMSKEEIEKIRKCSRSNAFWEKWYEQMAKKTVIRRILKYLRKNDSTYSSQYEDVVKIDDRNNDNETEEIESSESFLIDKLECK